MPDAAPPPDHDTDAGEAHPAPAATAGLLQVIGAVLWSFFGVRKGRAMRRDVVTIKAYQVVLVGIALAVLLVVTLLLLVRIIVANAS